ncbi:MAG: Na+/H+ antiporter NhaA [Fimbriimonas sp.]
MESPNPTPQPRSFIRTHTPAERAVRPFVRFARREASGGLILLGCALLALIWANSPWAKAYFHLWEIPIGVTVGGVSLDMPLGHFINDGLMALFFLLVGLEIKREILVGELSSLRQASLPLVAAVGGMVVPASLYALFNLGSPTIRGWGTPMATDIAFALGVLALLGSRVPTGLKVFLAALAIVDDIGSVLVIALFYSGGISGGWLAASGAVLVVMALMNRLGVRMLMPYGILFAVLWYVVHHSGIHATVAGVLAAFTIPTWSRIDGRRFVDRSRELLDEFECTGDCDNDVILNDAQTAALQSLEHGVERVTTPLQRLEHALHPWVAFFIMPVFAFANAGVSLVGGAGVPTGSVATGIFAGLVLGKPLGIYLLTRLAVKMRMAELPEGVTWRHVHGVAWLGGIGFTMSLFVSALAYGPSRELETAKVAILAASAVAGAVGCAILYRSTAKAARNGA